MSAAACSFVLIAVRNLAIAESFDGRKVDVMKPVILTFR
jgi:hypothetical protein